MLSYHRTTEEEKYIICDWRYDGEYAIYNNPPYEAQRSQRRGFANPENCFYSFVEGETLVGFVNLVEEETRVFLGIGVNPACCDRGYGHAMCIMARGISHEMYPGKPLYLEVRTWNTRAVKCYEKAGFRVVGAPFSQVTSIGEGTFFRMVAE